MILSVNHFDAVSSFRAPYFAPPNLNLVDYGSLRKSTYPLNSLPGFLSRRPYDP